MVKDDEIKLMELFINIKMTIINYKLVVTWQTNTLKWYCNEKAYYQMLILN